MRENAVLDDRWSRIRLTAQRRAAGTLGGLAVLLVGAVIGVVVVHQWRVVRRPGATPDEVVVLAAAALALALVAWLALSTLAVTLSYLPGRCGVLATRAADRCAPPLARRLAGALIGVAAVGMVAPTIASATAAPDATAPAVSAPAVSAPADTAVDGSGGPGFRGTTAPPSDEADGPAPGWTPTRPAVRAEATPILLTGAPAPEHDRVVVRRGDTLWDLARRDLGPDATDAEVARAWPLWFAVNRQVIGPDPGRLRPGQILQRPGPGTSRHDQTSPRADKASAGAHR